MNQYSTKRFFTVIGAVLLATVFMYCRPWRHKTPEERAESITKRVTKELDLTSTQLVTLNKIKEELLAKHKADRAERDTQYTELTQLIRNETIDRGKLDALKKRHAEMRDKAEELFLDKVVELHKALTPAQRTMAADALVKFERKFSGEK